jgi:uncharacterized protein (DUF488 family)
LPRSSKSSAKAKLIHTIGHSTHSIEEFLALLHQHDIGAVIDVRSFPSSRKWPHFNEKELKTSLIMDVIVYLVMKSLGGRRSGVNPDSPHRAWKIPAFHSYADYAEGVEFKKGFADLIAIASRERTAYMCSEGLWWRCHRRIISDHLLVAQWKVMHIMPDGKLVEHALPDFARVIDGRLRYDAEPNES